ncbi:MAG: phasin family protein [Burkholderiaceae bacterium]|nr:phasin family protein [Burkholderiaceae bacterium]MDH5208785.1 phasin family protein [Burkholderiaceae bacterium]
MAASSVQFVLVQCNKSTGIQIPSDEGTQTAGPLHRSYTMFTTPAQFAELQKGQMDAAVALSQTFFDAAERLMELNLAAAKATLEESVEKTQALLSAKDVQEFFALTSGNAQPTLEKAVSYSRTVYGITNGANAEVSRIIEAQIAESNKKVAQLIDFAAKNAPAGSEPAVTAFKSAVAAANTAYDTFAKATKQAVEMAESNVAAATSATMKAANAANDTVKVAKRRAA